MRKLVKCEPVRDPETVFPHGGRSKLLLEFLLWLSPRVNCDPEV